MPLGLLALCALACLTGCNPSPGVVVRTETVKVPVRQFVRLDPDLTAACPEVTRPQKACVQDGKPVFCNPQLVDILDATEAALDDVCNRVDLIRETEGKAGAK